MNDTNDNKTLAGQVSGTNDKPNSAATDRGANGKPAPTATNRGANGKTTLTDKEREKAEKERLLRQKAAREAETFKRRYFEYYDDIKHSYREDW